MPVQSLQALRAIYGEPSEIAQAKQIATLDAHCRTFIARSPFLVMATSDGQHVDASPKGDRPGFVQVDDAGDLLIPDWPGNRRIDGLQNLIENPWAGILFMIPNVRETLRVNGSASIHDESEIRQRFDHNGKSPITVLRITPNEVFLHCAKAFMRSKLWQPDTWPDRSEVPGMVEMLQAHARQTAYVSEAAMEERLRTTLY